MTIATGTRFGQYEIAAPLGKGGMGEVYLARDTRLERQVALKILPLDFTQSADRLRRFEQEAKTASALNHPNILTIHEIGAQNGTHFIATEFIAGQTLRDRLQQPLTQTEAIDIALQTAHALAAAHEAGIIHRDIKPENIMVRRDGLVKVLDFGLAKLAEARRRDTATERRGEDDSTLELSPAPSHTTEAGTVLGTASYMSPEQARGEKVDARTDVFSLGVVLYEMLAGQRPFEGVNMIDVLGAILHQEPVPLINVPDELQRIVTQALQKTRAQRYASIQDLQTDLRAFQRQLEFDAEAHRRTLGAHAACVPALVSDPLLRSESASHALARGPRALPGLRAPLLWVAALLVVTIAAYFFFARKATPAFSEREPLLLADFENKTGEEIWDGTLKQALAVALEQSPYMNIFPEERARDTLRLMNRSVDEPITRATGREICQRRNVRAMLVGTITKLERSYTLTLEATNAQSGETIARTLESAAGRDDVVKALERVAKELRGKLGESLMSLQKYDVSLAEATTNSLEALKAYSVGQGLIFKGQTEQGIAYLKRAVELDDQFGAAMIALAVRVNNINITESVPYFEKAWSLREKVGGNEEIDIVRAYHLYVTGDLDKAAEAGEMLPPLYSNNLGALASVYMRTGMHEKSFAGWQSAMQKNDGAFYRLQAARRLVALNRFDDAEQLINDGLKQFPDLVEYHQRLFEIASAKGDTEEVQRQLEWFKSIPPTDRTLFSQAWSEAFVGRANQAGKYFQQGAALSASRNNVEAQQRFLNREAIIRAYFGQPTKAIELASRVLMLQRNNKTLLRAHLGSMDDSPWPGWIFALSGDSTRAELLTDELVRANPQYTLILNVIAPLTRATIELQRGNPAQAIEVLQPAIQYEASPAASFRPNWIRGQAYLQLKQGAQAAAEFQKIIDHRGWDVTSPLWPLAHLGFARAAVLQGETAKAKQMYDEFFRLWKDADADLPVLIEAKKEYGKLK